MSFRFKSTNPLDENTQLANNKGRGGHAFFKKLFFMCIIWVVFTLVALEISYFVYKKFIRRQDIPSEINLGATTLFMRDKEIGYILKPNASTTHMKDWDKRKDDYDKQWHGLNKRISVNAAGYRGPLYPIERPDHTVRILTIGESTTWGCFNNDGETWPEYLEKILKNSIKGKNFQVINAAVGGYTSAQSLAIVKRKFQFYKPDIALIACWFNDMYNYDPSFPSPAADFDVKKNGMSFFGKGILYPFPGGRVLIDKLGTFISKFRAQKELTPEFVAEMQHPDMNFFKRYYARDKIWVKNYFDNVGSIIALLKKQNPKVKIFIVAMPSLFAPDSSQSFSEKFIPPDFDIPLYHRSYLYRDANSRLHFLIYYYHTLLFQRLVESRKKDFGYEVILGYPALGREPLQERDKYFYDEMHLSAQGNELLAQAIVRKLKSMDLF